MAMLDIHTLGLFCGFVGGLLLSYEAFVYLRTDMYTLAKSEQRVEQGYAAYAPSEHELEQKIREHLIPRVKRRKFLDAIGFALITMGFLFELLSLLLST